MVIRPHRRTGTVIGAAILLGMLGVAGALAWQILQRPPSFASFTAGAVCVALIGLAVLVVYWTYGCWSLSYRLDRNGLAIRWAGNEQRVPLDAVLTLVPGSSAPAPQKVGGVGWPGYHIGRGTLPEVGRPREVVFFSTHRSPQDLLYVLTSTLTYALSLPDAAAFAQELKLRRKLGSTESLEQSVRRWPLWDLPAWHDRLAIGLLGFGLCVNFVLFGYIALIMPALPSLIPMHFTPLGVADRIGFKAELFLLPTLGLLILFGNAAVTLLVHRQERLAAYLALGGALVAQGVLWGATYKLLG